jgi:hypothetical protein
MDDKLNKKSTDRINHLMISLTNRIFQTQLIFEIEKMFFTSELVKHFSRKTGVFYAIIDDPHPCLPV